MESYGFISSAPAWLAIVALLVSSYLLRRRSSKLNLLPGPKPWPIIGNLNLIGPLPHRSIHELSKIYGQIMHLKFGSRDVVVGSSVEMAKVILKTMDANFICRPKTAAAKYTAYNSGDMTWAPYGPFWRQARKMCSVELFSAKRMESYEYIRVEEMKSLIKTVHKSCGEEIALKKVLSTVGMDVISRMVLGKKYLDESESRDSVVSGEEFKRMMDELFLMNGVLNIGDFIPWIDFMDLQGYVKRMKVVSKKFDSFLEHVLNEHNARRNVERENFVPLDMVDLLLQHANDPTLQVKFERNGIKGFILDLLAGGTESSAVTVEWAIAEILKKPEIFKKATEELDAVIGRHRWVQEKDMPNLPYIRAIAKEAMRLHPVSPMLTPRRTIEDCNVAGYDIPKDTQVLVNAWSIARDPKLWDKPEEFCPERFIGNDIDVKLR